MQYVRNISDSVSTAWNSINPATLSGAIDVIVVENEDGSLSCSPFHVRFGKFSLLRPYEKKVEFKVNGVKQNHAMKLGEGGEAFFVFETTDTIPQSLQTSPLASPASSPPLAAEEVSQDGKFQEPEFLQLDGDSSKVGAPPLTRPGPSVIPAMGSGSRPSSRPGLLSPVATAPVLTGGLPHGDTSKSYHSEDLLPLRARSPPQSEHSEPNDNESEVSEGDSPTRSYRSRSPPPLQPREAIQRAMTLSAHLTAARISNHVTETGDLMLDMASYKSSEEDAIRAEVVARKILSEELEGDYDIGALFGMDEEGNLWIYNSEEAKDAAMQKMAASLRPSPALALDAASDPGYQSDDSTTSSPETSHRRSESDVGQTSISTPPTTPGSSSAGNPNRNYAKTLRLTSDQLKELNLKSGENSMSFTVNRATCQCNMYLWKQETPVVISDIDGTITKSDALGHVLNMIGRDWTHAGVAKLYSDIAANGYNIMYLTSRSVGQADTTRAYLNGIVQDGYRVPRGPTILSPDRTMAALRREIYLRKPHVFKMATLRDIRSLYGPDNHCFYAGFGNRLTDQISYRTVDVPRNRIFTINSNAEVSLDLLSLNKLKLSYVNMTEVVDHYFPPVSTLVKGGGDEYTDFKYWRDMPLELDDFSASDSDDVDRRADLEDEDDEEDDEVGQMGESYISHGDDEELDEGAENMMDSIIQDEEDADDESEGYDEGEDDGPEALQRDTEDEQDEEDIEATAIRAKETSAKPVEPSKAVWDPNAEIISGIKSLGMERKGE